MAEDTFDENVSICTLLIDYCQKLLPNKKDAVIEVKKEID